jgi:peroxiredoxin
MKSRWIVAAASALALTLLTLPTLLNGSHDEGADFSAAAPACKASGKAKLDFKLKDMHGKTVNLAAYKGQVILLNFWATWCGPCKVEIPEFVRAYTEHKNKGFVVLGVSIDDTPEQLKEFASQWKVNYPMLLNDEKLEQAYGPIYGVPVSIFIGRDGSICRKHMGEVKKEILERELKALL